MPFAVVMEDLQNLRPLVKILWDYNKLSQPAQEADFLILMGTDDERVVDHAVLLDRQFDYKYIVVTGGVSHEKSILQQIFGDTEANFFAKRLIAQEIDPEKIIIENHARNTGDNITLSKDMLLSLNQNFKSGQLVHMPSMERRALATAEKQWPEIEWSVSSQNISYDDYVVGINETRLINGIVGDTFRILDYPARGFQTFQPMPDTVKDALDKLIQAGFNKRIPEAHI